ncbi:VC0807 family protein [Tengunoibacter tsumagoiensis]|uniref:Major facilitator superfamily (MFS) profile domain-containing protein n=1 Tax=Tengunoibacter tsumagoiensis TaxID=2014871 RepID=A0A401ZWC9_9CHLR|nr:VC0807 family protein [Tengunoibacter tsumagoiensis]GCE11188.1 hypothetical protein KTT_10470 [Tengunoibacter tsumagoiensis]
MRKEDHSLRRFDLSGVIPGSILQSCVLYAACPYMLYQILSSRISPLVALLLAALFPLAGLGAALARRRLLDLIALASLLTILFTFAGFWLDRMPQALLLQLLLPVGLVSLLILVSQSLSKPFFFYVDRYFVTRHQLSELESYREQWETLPTYRAMIYRLNLVWGIALLIATLLLPGLYFFIGSEQTAPLLPYGLYALVLLLTVWTIHKKSPAPDEEPL